MPLPSQVASSPLELIGNTPVVQLCRVAKAGGARVFGKLDAFNPSGSVKDRICVAMIDAAEKDGRLRPGGTIVEPTSGNTGIALAMVAAARGYRLILTMPETMSEERRSLLKAYGAEIVLTPDRNGMQAAIDEARRIEASDPGFFMPCQFSNPANPEAHRLTTAREILAQCERIDAFVAGVGTGGTITGVGSVLKVERPGVLIVAVEPSGSPVLSGGRPGVHRIQGIGAGFVPSNLDRSLIDRVIAVDDDEAERMTRRLAAEEGILVGISAGAAALAAVTVAGDLATDAVVLCLLCDSGERYLTTNIFEQGGGLVSGPGREADFACGPRRANPDAAVSSFGALGRESGSARERLRAVLADMGSMVIAYSGGVDSTLLVRAAADTPGLRFIALTTRSPTNTAEEVDSAVRVAREIGAEHLVVDVDELATPGYAANPAHRCYLCKQTLYPVCEGVARERGFAFVADGVNTDDLGDFRPGLRAAAQRGVRHPLVEADLSKAAVRELSRGYGLATAEQPASPCLSSRFPYGTAITRAGLARVAAAEAALHRLGFVELRVRFLGDAARVEVAAAEMPRLTDAALRGEVRRAVLGAGFKTVTLSESPLRSGSLNDVLGAVARAGIDTITLSPMPRRIP